MNSHRDLIEIVVLHLVVIALVFIDIVFVNVGLAFLLVITYVVSRYNVHIKSLFGVKESLYKTVGLSLIYAALILGFTTVVLYPLTLEITQVPIDYGRFEAIKGNTMGLLLALLIGWIFGGFLEEVIFRGYLLQTLENFLPKQIGLVFALLSSSLLFGYLHEYQGISGQILTGSMGLFLALIFVVHKRNLWLNVLTHGFVNTFSMLLIYYN